MSTPAPLSAPCANPLSPRPPVGDTAQGAFLFASRTGDSHAPPLATGVGAGGDLPAYGSLSSHDEYQLWLHDFPRWAVYVAPRWVDHVLATDEGLKASAHLLLLKPALKRAIWAIASPELRQRLTDHFARQAEAADV